MYAHQSVILLSGRV